MIYDHINQFDMIFFNDPLCYVKFVLMQTICRINLINSPLGARGSLIRCKSVPHPHHVIDTKVLYFIDK
jgi:hypothetical protein